MFTRVVKTLVVMLVVLAAIAAREALAADPLDIVPSDIQAWSDQVPVESEQRITATDTPAPEVTGEPQPTEKVEPTPVIAEPTATPEPTQGLAGLPTEEATAIAVDTPTTRSTPTPEVSATTISDATATPTSETQPGSDPHTATPTPTSTHASSETPSPSPTATASTGTNGGGSPMLSILAISNPLASDFTGVTLDGTNKTTTASLDSFTVSDTRIVASGWHITVQAEQFTGSQNHDLAKGSLTMSKPNVSGIGTLPSVDPGPYTIDAATAVRVASAASGTGLGLYMFSATMLSLSIPASTYADTYNSTITVSIISGP